MTARVLAAIVAAAGCATPVDPEPLGDYTTWKRIDVTGEAPGHGDTYRIIYVNPVATAAPDDVATLYPTGSIIAKEIRDDDGGFPGALRYIAIMRRLDDAAPTYAAEGGWLFSETDEPGGAETHRSLCWRRCHVAAPYAGAFYDYRD